jgi:hypothetical protein
MADDADSFLSRWSRRKAGVRSGAAVPADPVVREAARPSVPEVTPAARLDDAATAARTEPDTAGADLATAPPPPTLADVALLTHDADYTRYLAGNVDPAVRNAALKHLFTDPHFNVMDGLDIYVGDYNTPDPLPAGMLHQMVQSQMLGLFDDEAESQALPAEAPAESPVAADPSPPVPTAPADPPCLAADENPDLQLQPDDGAGCPGTEPGTGENAGRPD